MESRSIVNQLTPLPLRNPLTRGYLTRNKMFALALTCFDGLLNIVLPQSVYRDQSSPRRILIANWGQLGDVVYASAFITLIREFFPEAEIGFLVSSVGATGLSGLTGIQHIHRVDHWFQLREPISRLRKIKLYLASRKTALKQLRETNYDVAIETFSHPPNSGSLLWQAGIPRRIGYSIGSGRRFFTDLIQWKHDPKRHVLSDHLQLFEVLLGRPSYRTVAPALLPKPTGKLAEDVPVTLPSSYVILHVGTGGPLKEWPIENWKKLTLMLSAQSIPLVFTGRGEREAAIVRDIVAESPRSTNLCNLLSYNQFVCVLRNANVMVGVDSVAAHLAGVLDIPGVLIYHGMADILRWSPISQKTVVLSAPLACSPCLNGKGCETMRCVREVSAEEVADNCLRALRSYSPLMVAGDPTTAYASANLML